MLVGVLVLSLSMPWVSSLKEKRMILRSLVHSTSHKFRISIAESGSQDILQTGEITLAILASSRKQGDSMLDNVLNYICSRTEAEITPIHREFL